MTTNPGQKLLKGAFERMYSEGSRTETKWDKKTLNDMLRRVIPQPDPVNTPEVQAFLGTWEKQGFIKIIGRDEAYLEVLKPGMPA